MEHEIDIFVEFRWDDGTLIRVPYTTWFETQEDLDGKLGSWWASDDLDLEKAYACPGYGYLESMAQNDDYSGLFYSRNGRIIQISAWRK